MGIQTVTMSRMYKGQKLAKQGMATLDGRGEGEEIFWERFPITGISKVLVNF